MNIIERRVDRVTAELVENALRILEEQGPMEALNFMVDAGLPTEVAYRVTASPAFQRGSSETVVNFVGEKMEKPDVQMTNSHAHQYRGYLVEVGLKNRTVTGLYIGSYLITDHQGDAVAYGDTPNMPSADMADRVAMSLALATVDSVIRQEGTLSS